VRPLDFLIKPENKEKAEAAQLRDLGQLSKNSDLPLTLGMQVIRISKHII
jgi:hypothetical protein